MRNRIIGFSLVFISLLLIDGCKKKYPENTFGTIKSPARRLTSRVWYLDEYYVNDVIDYTYKNKKYKETYSELCGTSVNCNEGSVCAECILFDPGKTYYWTLSKDENTFKRSEVGTVGNFYDEISILKLSNNSYWYSYNKDGVKYEYRLKRFK